jgi:ankyrin repeat protein
VWKNFKQLLICCTVFLKLLRNRADVNFTNEHGNTPLHYACFWGYQAVAEDLVTHGALVSLANKDGDTPLDKARGTLAKRLHGKLLCPMTGVPVIASLL